MIRAQEVRITILKYFLNKNGKGQSVIHRAILLKNDHNNGIEDNCHCLLK
jgi:hypothetical protein